MPGAAQAQPNPNIGMQPAGYTPVFNSNGQVTGQTGSFAAVPPQNPAMETDTHGVPGFLKRNKK